MYELRLNVGVTSSHRLWIATLTGIAAFRKRMGFSGAALGKLHPIELVKVLRRTLLNRKFYTKRTAGAIIVLLLVVHKLLKGHGPGVPETEVSFSSFAHMLRDPATVQNLRISPDVAEFAWHGQKFFTRMVKGSPGLIEFLLSTGVDFRAVSKPPSAFSIVAQLVSFVWMFMIFR
jgi:hypothetical protein